MMPKTESFTDLSGLFDVMPDAVYLMMPVKEGNGAVVDFEIMYANKTAQQLPGLPVGEDIIGKSLFKDELFDENSRQSAFNQYLQVLQTDQPQEYSYYNKTLGTSLDIWRSKYKEGVLNITRDRKALRVAIEKEQKGEQFLKAIIEHSPIGIVYYKTVRDSAGNVTDFAPKLHNEKILQLSGLDKAEFERENFSYWNKDGYFDALGEAYKKVIETGQPYATEYYSHLKDKWFNLNVIKLDDGLLINLIDITDTKKYLRAFEQSAAHLKKIIDTSQSGIFCFAPVLDESGDVTEFTFTISNPTLSAYVGQEPDAIIGATGSTWFPAYKTNGLFQKYKDTYVTGRTNRFDFHYNADGIDVWLDIMATKMDNEVLVTFTDFTVVKNLQLQLEGLVNELKNSNKSLEEFAYAASHDLQEPLRKINFYADRFKEKFQTALGEEGSGILSRMESATSRMRTLIDDLLAYSKISASKNPFEAVDTSIVVNEVILDLETAIQEKKAVIKVAQLPEVLCDKVQLRQLFQNLIGNSLKYSKPDVPPFIEIKSQQVSGKEVTKNVPHADAQRSYYFIQVTDNGLGFEQENAERIFQIFQRLHGRSEYPGTGVGLAIVQKVVANHNGYIVAEGEHDVGAVFKIYLPA